MLKPLQKGGIIMSTYYARPKSFIARLWRKDKRPLPENNLRNLEARAKAAKGDTYRLVAKLRETIKIKI